MSYIEIFLFYFYVGFDPWPSALGFKGSVEVKGSLFEENKFGLRSSAACLDCQLRAESAVKSIR